MNASTFCPLYGFTPPCERCMWALKKKGRIFCAVAWAARKQVHGGRGQEGQNLNGHAFAPWIINSMKEER